MLPTSPLCTSLYDSDLVGVEFRRHGGGKWCQNNVDFWWPKEAASLPPPSWKCCQVFSQKTNYCYLKHVCNGFYLLSYINRWGSPHLHKQWFPCDAQHSLLFFLASPTACQILIPPGGTEPEPPVFGGQSPPGKSHSLLSWLFNNKTVLFISTSGKRIFWIGRRFYF